MHPLDPARLLLRALDDLHALAEFARGNSRSVDRLEAAAERVERAMRSVEPDLETIAETAEPLQGAAERVGRWVKPKR